MKKNPLLISVLATVLFTSIAHALHLAIGGGYAGRHVAVGAALSFGRRAPVYAAAPVYTYRPNIPWHALTGQACPPPDPYYRPWGADRHVYVAPTYVAAPAPVVVTLAPAPVVVTPARPRDSHPDLQWTFNQHGLQPLGTQITTGLRLTGRKSTH